MSLTSILDPPSVSVSPTQLLTAESTNATFTCKGFGVPLPELSWLNKEGLQLHEVPGAMVISTESMLNSSGFLIATSNLTLFSVQTSEAMNYTCRGSSRVPGIVGVPRSATCELIIKGRLFGSSYHKLCHVYDHVFIVRPPLFASRVVV